MLTTISMVMIRRIHILNLNDGVCMLLIETLVEDRSGSVIMDQVLRKMIAAQPYPWTSRVRPPGQWKFSA